MKDIVLTVSLNDTAYREFLNILMHSIAKRMYEIHKDEYPVKHLFYMARNGYDVEYFILAERMKVEKNLIIANVSREGEIEKALRPKRRKRR